MNKLIVGIICINYQKLNNTYSKNTTVSEAMKSASRVFFTGKNLALYYVNAQIFLMASAKSHGQHFYTFLHFRIFACRICLFARLYKLLPVWRKGPSNLVGVLLFSLLHPVI
ncbi:MAG: hypothetical protein MR958_04250 [Spirochaetia bacterium]|nr:hypothetical protein [Spirochaetia bacterium]